MLLLPIMLFVPLFFLVILMVSDKRYAHDITVASSSIVLILSAAVLYLVHANGLSYLSASIAYIPTLNLGFSLSLSQPSLILLIMTAVVFFASSLVGEYFIGKVGRVYSTVFLVAETASLGVFMAANLFLLYLFWEVAEVMVFFIIFLYGGYNRRYASIKFLIYSIISSLLLLIGIIVLYNSVTPHSFDIGAIIGASQSIPLKAQLEILVLFLVAFMIKMPAFPFHSWLPDAHTEAPTTGSMILAGVLLKFGGYGLYLMFLMLPIAAHYSLYLFLIFLVLVIL